MSRRKKKGTSGHSSKSEVNDLDRGKRNPASPELVTLGCGSRSRFVETEHESTTPTRLRGLLPVPPDVEAEIAEQETTHAMSPEYRKILRDRLTLGHYFSDVEVAFRRTPAGIEILAVGPEEIGEFRATTRPEERQGVVYGVG